MSNLDSYFEYTFCEATTTKRGILDPKCAGIHTVHIDDIIPNKHTCTCISEIM